MIWAFSRAIISPSSLGLGDADVRQDQGSIATGAAFGGVRENFCSFSFFS